MTDIICPGCGKAFKIDGSGYAEIVKQVRDKEFKEAISEKLHSLEAEKKSAVELANANKDSEIAKLKADLQSNELKSQLNIKEATTKLEKERDSLKQSLEARALEKQLLESSLNEKYQLELKTKDEQI